MIGPWESGKLDLGGLKQAAPYLKQAVILIIKFYLTHHWTKISYHNYYIYNLSSLLYVLAGVYEVFMCIHINI